jgi:hypothetical protein
MTPYVNEINPFWKSSASKSDFMDFLKPKINRSVISLTLFSRALITAFAFNPKSRPSLILIYSAQLKKRIADRLRSE